MMQLPDRWTRPFYLSPPPDAPIPEASTPIASSPSRRVTLRILNVLAVLVLSLLLYHGTLALYVKHNDAPLSTHPDEPSKVQQLLTDTRNYNHPQLMLEAARRLVPGLEVEPPRNAFGYRVRQLDPQTLAEQARGVSARFAAAAAVLMALAGFAAARWPGFLAIAAAVGLCPALLSHAHFFKEDPALVFGVAWVICAGAWMCRARSPGLLVWTTVALGVGVGLAASGKYAGAVMLAPAAAIALLATLCRRQWGLAVAAPLIVIAVAASTWAVVNYRVFDDFNAFRASFEYEKLHAEKEHRGLTMDTPTGYFADAVWTDAMPHVKALALIGLGLLGWRMGRRRSWGFGAWLVLAIGVYAHALAYSVIPFFRYALPVTVMLHAFAGLAAAWLMTLPRRPLHRAIALAIVVGGIATLQGLRCADYTAQFADDSRPALRAWVNANFPPNTPVAADNYAELSNGRGWGPWLLATNTRARVVRVFDASGGIEPVAELRRRGIKYVITAGSATDRFLSPYVKGTPAGQAAFTQRQQFYRELQQCPIAWSRIAKHPMRTFANPDILVYRIDSTP